MSHKTAPPLGPQQATEHHEPHQHPISNKPTVTVTVTETVLTMGSPLPRELSQQVRPYGQYDTLYASDQKEQPTTPKPPLRSSANPATNTMSAAKFERSANCHLTRAARHSVSLALMGVCGRYQNGYITNLQPSAAMENAKHTGPPVSQANIKGLRFADGGKPARLEELAKTAMKLGKPDANGMPLSVGEITVYNVTGTNTYDLKAKAGHLDGLPVIIGLHNLLDSPEFKTLISNHDALSITHATAAIGDGPEFVVR